MRSYYNIKFINYQKGEHYEIGIAYEINRRGNFISIQKENGVFIDYPLALYDRVQVTRIDPVEDIEL